MCASVYAYVSVCVQLCATVRACVCVEEFFGSCVGGIGQFAAVTDSPPEVSLEYSGARGE